MIEFALRGAETVSASLIGRVMAEFCRVLDLRTSCRTSRAPEPAALASTRGWSSPLNSVAHNFEKCAR